MRAGDVFGRGDAVGSRGWSACADHDGKCGDGSVSAGRAGTGYRSHPLLEEILIHFLNMQDFLDPTSHIVADHEFGQMLTIDQDDPLAQEFRGFLG